MIKPKNQIKNIEITNKNDDKEYRLKLDKNENIYGTSPYAISALKNFDYEKINLFPSCSEYINKFAKIFNLDHETIMFYSGLDFVLYLILNTYLNQDDEFLCCKNDANKAELYADFIGAETKYIEFNNEFELSYVEIKNKITEKTKICYFSTPNDLTGYTLRASNIAKLLKEFQNTLFIIDISLIGFAFDIDFKDYTDLVDYFSNVIIIKSYSNDYALAGIDTGVAVSQKENIETLKALQPDNQISEFDFKALISALNDEKHIFKTKEENKEAYDLFFQGLSDIGFKPYPSEANFILCNFKSYCNFYYNKLKNNGIIVKKFDKNSRFSSCLRITVPKISGVKFILKLLKIKDIIAFALEDTLTANEKLLINEEILEAFSINYDIVLVSNKSKEEILSELEKFNIKKYFSYIKSETSEITKIVTNCPHKSLTLIVSNNEILSSAKKANIKSIALINEENNNNSAINNFKHFGCDDIVFKENLPKYFDLTI